MAPVDNPGSGAPEGRPPASDAAPNPANPAEVARLEREKAKAANPAGAPAPNTATPAATEDGEPEDTSGRPPLAQVAADRVDNRNTRVIETDVQEED